MTDDDLRIVAEFYNEVNATAGAKIFLRNCSSFGLIAGSTKCVLPNHLQFRIKKLIESYLDELKEKQSKM